MALISSLNLLRSSSSAAWSGAVPCNVQSSVKDAPLYNVCHVLVPMSATYMTYKAPELPNGRITPELVRDELLTCFESANREFARLLNQPVTDEALKEQVRTLRRVSFQQMWRKLHKSC